MQKLVAALALTLVLGIAGCGNDPVPVPSLHATASPDGIKSFALPGGDVTFSYPANWALIAREPPGVATVASGGAQVTVWAYRTVSLVTNPATAAKALARLVASLKRRDPGFVVTKTDVTTVFQAPAVEIDGRSKIGGRPVAVRSVHIYSGVGEYVVDAFADPAVFDRADREVFQPLLVSLKVYGRPPLAVQGATAPGAPGASTATPAPGG